VFPANHPFLLLILLQDSKLMNTQEARGRSQNMKLKARILNIHHLVEGEMSWMRMNMRKMLKCHCQMKKWRLDCLASHWTLFSEG
jgi:hypothetical protein